MSDREKLNQAMFKAMDEVNEQLPVGDKLDKSLDTVLFGDGAKLDSLGLAGFIVAAEEVIQEEFGVALTLADERALSQKDSPFRTIGTLAEYVFSLLQENTVKKT